MARKPEQAFEILYGRQPNDTDRLRLMRVKDALGLRDDDDMWAVFIALGHFQALYEDIPQQIVDKTAEVCGIISTAAEKATIARLSASVVTQVNKIAGKRAARNVILAASLAVLVTVGACVGVAGVTYSIYRDRITAKEAELAADAQHSIDARVGQDEALVRALRVASGIKGAFPDDYGVRLVTAATISPQRLDWVKQHIDVVDWTQQAGLDTLSNAQRNRIAAIVTDADAWTKVSIANHSTWPCVKEYPNSDGFHIKGAIPLMCEVGIGVVK